MIRIFSREHLNQVVDLHQAELTGLLAELGRPALRAYYEGSLESRLALTLVVEQRGAVSGFVSGSTCPSALRRELVRRNPVGVAFGLVAGFLRRPRTLVAFADSLRQKSSPSCGPELIYLAVAPEARGQRIGEHLVRAFGENLRRRDVFSYELSVDADNHTARGFYESLGFRQIRRYEEFGVEHLRLEIGESNTTEPVSITDCQKETEPV